MAAAVRIGLLIAGSTLVHSLPAKGQVPGEIGEKLLAIGFGDSLEPSMAIYQPLLAAAPKGDLLIEKDVRYGEHERNLLDLYRPRGIEGAAVLVYVHGGGYRTGDRDLTPLVYANIPTYFGRHGLLAMSATYRLAPEAAWPSGAEDMHALIAWVRKHARAYGGDPERIFLMGHSAGATHVATYAFDSRFQPPEGHGLAGIVLVSGRYRLRSDPDDPSLDSIREYFGSDSAQYESRSAITHVPGSEVPALLVVAEYDQRNLVDTTGELFVALCQRDDGRCPRFLQLRHHNHLSEVFHINTEDELLGQEILDFVEGALRASGSDLAGGERPSPGEAEPEQRAGEEIDENTGSRLSPTSVQWYAYVATPKNRRAGRRSFCAGPTGTICVTEDRTLPGVVNGRCEPCKPLE